MNDNTIPSQHGAPLRVIVPGHVGVRNVKWLKSIKISNEEAIGTWQRGMAYKVWFGIRFHNKILQYHYK